MSAVLEIVWSIVKILLYMLIPFGALLVMFVSLCFVWYLIIKYKYGMDMPVSGTVKVKKHSLLRQLLVDVPKRFMLDKFNREPGYFDPKGIHMFCGEQGAGKTIAAVEMILRLQKQYPQCRTITNFGLTTENTALEQWQQLLTYTNGHKGVVVGIDEIQNWFMSGKNQLPEQMLEVATQNRKNNRIMPERYGDHIPC